MCSHGSHGITMGIGINANGMVSSIFMTTFQFLSHNSQFSVFNARKTKTAEDRH